MLIYVIETLNSKTVARYLIKSHRGRAGEYSTMKVGPLPSIPEYSALLF